MIHYMMTEEIGDSKISLNSVKMEINDMLSPIPYRGPSLSSEGGASEVPDERFSNNLPKLTTLPKMELTEVSSPTPSVNSANISEPRLRLLDGKYFHFLPEDSTGNIVVALCIKCAPQKVKVRGYNNCSSNFLGHLKRKHGEDCLNEYKDYMQIKHRKKWSHNNTVKRETRSSNIFNSTKIFEGPKDQDQFDDNIIKYFIHSMIPLRVLDDPYFANIFSFFNINATGLNLMSIQTLKHRINEYYNKEINDIKSQLNQINYVCITIDIWPGEKQNILGITAHWITNDLVSVSVALACRKFKNIHNNDAIFPLIQEINADFGLTVNNVVATIVNNDRNLIKAFKMFGVQLQNFNKVAHKDDVPDTISSDSEDLEEEDHNILTLPNLDTMKISSLPVRLECCGHTLILCATIDANMALTDKNTMLSTMHNAVMEKCNALWKAAGEHTSAEIIQNVLQHTLSRPDVTRWNSLYDSLQQILSIEDKYEELHKALNLNPINEFEFTYLSEYLLCAKPITEALDIMQRENNRYYGIVLPCLFALRKKLKKIERKHKFVYCKSLIKTYIGSVETRFSQFFDLNTPESEIAAIAALSYPRFKNSWISCLEPVQRNKVLNTFKIIISKQIHQKSETVTNSNIRNESMFFNFDSDSETESVKIQPAMQLSAPLIKAELLLLNFFAEQSQELSVLNNYPEIKHVFIKYNTALPSSAAIERLFCYNTIKNLLKSSELSEEMFEKRVILKSNLNYKKI